MKNKIQLCAFRHNTSKHKASNVAECHWAKFSQLNNKINSSLCGIFANFSQLNNKG